MGIATYVIQNVHLHIKGSEKTTVEMFNFVELSNFLFFFFAHRIFLFP